MMKSDLFQNNSQSDEMEIKTWEILTYLAYVEMLSFDGSNLSDDVYIRTNLNTELDKLTDLILNRKEYPCSYLFIFRDNLLNTSGKQFTDVRKFSIHITGIERIYIYFFFPLYFQKSPWNRYGKLIDEGMIKICEKYSDNNKLQMYMDIISSVYDPEFEKIKGRTSFNHLINALKLPVFTSEVNINE